MTGELLVSYMGVRMGEGGAGVAISPQFSAIVVHQSYSFVGGLGCGEMPPPRRPKLIFTS